MHSRTHGIRIALITFGAAVCLAGLAHAAGTAKKPMRHKVAPLSDANIAAIVLAANTIDIDNAQVALKTSSDSTVKAFAQQMVTDHTSVNDKAKALAAKLNLTPKPNTTSRNLVMQTSEKRATIAKLTGRSFDKAYLDNEISYHQAVIDMLSNKLVPGAKNAELKDLLTSVQPAFEAHLEHAKQARASLGE